MEAEVNAIKQNNTLSLKNLRPGKQSISCKRV